MLSSSFLLIHSLVFFFLTPFIYATPFKRDADLMSDSDILNFALFTERLSLAVLSDGLTKFTTEDFVDAGLPPFVHGRLEEVAQHDSTHITYLAAAISDAGGKPVPDCDYQFQDLDPRSLLDVLSVTKSVMVSMYDGSIAFLARKQLTTLASSILGVEARHAAWITSAAQKDNPWNTAFETPLTRRHAYSLLSPYVVNCSDNNPILPDAFPPLTFLSAPVPGQVVQFDMSHVSAMDGNAQQLLRENHVSMAFLKGEGIQYAPVHVSENHIFEVLIPKNLKGIVYAILVNGNKKLSDVTTIAGPALLNFRYNSNGVLE